MRLFIILVLSLVLMAIAYSAFMKRRIEVTLPLAIFTSILIIYGFGLAGKMKWGVYAFGAFTVLMFLIGIIASIAKRQFKNLMGCIFTIGFFVFIAAVIFSLYMTNGRLLSKFDEFTHWGLTVKNFMIFDGFANIKGSTTHGAGYQPAISIFCYFFTALKGTFSESDALCAMNIYTFALLLPIFRKVTWKRILIGICMLPLIVSIPWLFSFAITPYNTLLTDAALAITFAYLLYHYFTHEQSASTYISLGLGSAVLILIKPSSEVFALAVFLLVIIDVLAFKRKEFANMWRRKGGGFGFIFYILLSAGAYASWKLFTAKNHMLQVFDYVEVTSEKTKDAQGIISHYLKALLTNTGNEKLNMPYIWWIAIFAGLAIIAIILAKGKREKGRTTLFSTLFIVGYVAFLAALCFMYIFLFIPIEAKSLASMDRYICTFLLGGSIFYIYLIIDEMIEKFEGIGLIIVIFPIALVALFAPWGKINSSMLKCEKTIEKTQTKREAYTIAEKTFEQMNYKKDRVYFIAQDTNGLEYQTAYYLATPVLLSYDYEMGWSLGSPYSVKDVWSLDMSKEEWEKALIDGDYTYVYLYNVDDKFRERFSKLFKDEKDIINNTCFKIKKSGKHIKLEKALATK